MASKSKRRVFGGVRSNSVRPGMRHVVKFDDSNYREVRQADHVINVFRLNAVKRSLPALDLFYADKRWHRHLRQNNAVGQSLADSKVEHLLDFSKWLPSEIGRFANRCYLARLSSEGREKGYCDHRKDDQGHESLHFGLIPSCLPQPIIPIAYPLASIRLAARWNAPNNQIATDRFKRPLFGFSKTPEGNHWQ